MEILYYFKDRDTFMDKWQHDHIFNELKRSSINFTVISPLKYETKSEAKRALEIEFESGKYDLFMTCLEDWEFDLELLLKIKKLKIPSLLICFDNLTVPFSHKKVCKYFDLVWLTSKDTEYLFKRWGANTIVLPYAANPFIYKGQDIVDNQEVNRICFIGTPHGSRVNTINNLLHAGIDTTLFVAKDKINSSKVSNLSKVAAIKNYINLLKNFPKYKNGRKIILGFLKQKLQVKPLLDTNLENIELLEPIGSMKKVFQIYNNFSLSISPTEARNTGVLKEPVNIICLRNFEVPMAGGIQICRYSEEIANYFEDGKEIVLYRSKEEMIEKTKFYLDPRKKELRRKMKQAARKRAERDHTWTNRFNSVFRCLKLEH